MSGIFTGLGVLGVGGLRPRFKPSMSTAEFKTLVEKSLATTPDELATQIRTVLDVATASMSDESVLKAAEKLRASGGITLDTAAAIVPEKPLNTAQSLAVAQVLTDQFKAWIPTARAALKSGDPAKVEEAILGFITYLKPVAGYEASRTTAGRVLRAEQLTGKDIGDIRAAHANVTGLPAGSTPEDRLKAMLAPFDETKAFVQKHTSPQYRKLVEQAQTAAASGDEAAVQQSLFALQEAAGVPTSEKEIIQAVIKEQTGQTSIFPTRAPKEPPATVPEGTAEMTVRDVNVEQAKPEGFGLTPDLRGTPTPKQQSLLPPETKNIPEGTVEMLVRNINERLAKKKGFTLTGRMGKGRGPQQLDLELFPRIIQEEPEQLALSLARGDAYNSREYLKLITQIRHDLEAGSDADIAKTYNRLRTRLGLGEPKPPKAPVEPARLMADEIKALQASFKKASGGMDLNPQQMLTAIVADPDLNPQRLAENIANLKKGGWGDVVQWVLINGMLSPASDLLNMTATASTLVWNIGMRAAAGQIGKVDRAITGSAGGVVPGEATEMLHGAYASFWDAVGAAKQAMKTGESTFRADRLELRNLNPLTGTNIARLLGSTASGPVLQATGPFGRAIDFFGHTFGVTGRLMLAGDEFLKAMATSAEAHALTYRTAYNASVKNNLSFDEFKNLYNLTHEEVMKQLPGSLRKQAEDFALYTTLNHDLGNIGQSVLNTRQALNKYTYFGGTAVMPFFRTLANSAKQTGENTPLAIFSNAVRRDMFGPDPVKRDLALAKWSMGTIFMSSMYMLAASGKITGGGPADPVLRHQMERAGWKPYSYVTADGTALPIPEWLGIPGNLIKMAADMAEVNHYADDTTKEVYAGTLIGAYVGNLSFDFLKDSSNIFAGFVHGFRTQEDMNSLVKVPGAMIPGASMIRLGEKILGKATGNEVMMKDARETLDKIRARFPGYDTLAKVYGMPTVPLARDLYGEPIAPASFWTQPKSDEFIDGLNRLGMVVPPPPRKYREDILPNDQYEALRIAVGAQIKELSTNPSVLNVIRASGVPDAVKRDVLHDQIEKAREAGTKLWIAAQEGQPLKAAKERKAKARTLSIE